MGGLIFLAEGEDTSATLEWALFTLLIRGGSENYYDCSECVQLLIIGQI